MDAKGWMPRSWEAELAGCIWLPRILDKGRRILESERHGNAPRAVLSIAA